MFWNVSKNKPSPFHLSSRPKTGPSRWSCALTSQMAIPSPYRCCDAPLARSSSMALHSGMARGCCDTIQPLDPCASAVRRTKERCATAVPPRSHCCTWRAPVKGLMSLNGARKEYSFSIAGGPWPHAGTAHAKMAPSTRRSVISQLRRGGAVRWRRDAACTLVDA